MITKLVSPKSVTSTERVGIAMLKIAKHGSADKILTNPKINEATAS